MRNSLLALFGKTISTASYKLNLGSGATWPGHIALKVNKNFIRETISQNTKIVLVAGTNGKTTTATMITHILKQANFKVAHNKTGANQLNGVSSIIIQDLPIFSSKLKVDYLILEIDENVLPLLLNHLTPDYIIALNLFRDQLDRYGEIDSIIKRWKSSFEKLSDKTTLILNSDDPQISYLGENVKAKRLYFGLSIKGQDGLKHGADSIYCPKCKTNLNYKSVVFSHLGDWACPKCGLKRIKPDIESFDSYPLSGNYNKYNTLAAVLLAKDIKLPSTKIKEAIESFKPAFGRQEEFAVEGKRVKIFLSKNPTSFNQSLATIYDLKAQNILIILNDRYVDGQDVSWIWDTDVNDLNHFNNVVVSGDRAFDMGLRLKYSLPSELNPPAGEIKFKIEPDLEKATLLALKQTSSNQALYILPTYTAMLDVRKILKGRKIL